MKLLGCHGGVNVHSQLVPASAPVPPSPSIERNSVRFDPRRHLNISSKFASNVDSVRLPGNIGDKFRTRAGADFYRQGAQPCAGE